MIVKDDIISQINDGLYTLKDKANLISTNVDRQTMAMDSLSSEIDSASSQLETSNAKLKQIVEKVKEIFYFLLKI